MVLFVPILQYFHSFSYSSNLHIFLSFIIQHHLTFHFIKIHFDYKQCYIHLPQDYPCSCFLNFKGITEVQWCFLLNRYINHINLVKPIFHYCCLFPSWILGWIMSPHKGDSHKGNKQTNKRSGKICTYLFQHYANSKKISGNVRKWLTIIVLKAHNVSIHKLKENTITKM